MSIVTSSLGAQYVSASQTDWMNERVDYFAESPAHSDYDDRPVHPSMGEKKKVPVVWAGGQVQMREGYELRTETASLAYIPQLDQWFIAFDSDTAYKYISGGRMVWFEFWAVDNGRKVVVRYKEGWGDGFKIAIVGDLQPYMKPMFDGSAPYYETQVEELPFWLQRIDETGQKHEATVHSVTFSKNMRYGVFWLDWKQFVRVEFTDQNNEAIGFSNRGGAWYGGIYNSRASAITDDGKYVFMDDGQSVVSINAACGVTVAAERYHTAGIEYDYPPCRKRTLDPTHVAGYDAWHTGFVLAEDERSFTYVLQLYPNTTGSGLYTTKKVTVRLYDTPGLKYLALGDSYSSGEGNLNNPDDGKAGYRWGTNVDGDGTKPREKCRISEVSYPYLLASRFNYGEPVIGPGALWSSVACSGALIGDLSGTGSSSYLGQDNKGVPRLKSFDVSTLKGEALTGMIPGRHKQVEFIKRYKPKAVTLSVGGNDSQFNTIITSCVKPAGDGGEWTTTCSYAKDDGKKANFAHSIYALRNKLIDLYEELLIAGPDDMKLYVIGYPLIVDADTPNKDCGASVRLNSSERMMVVESTKFINMITRSAADQAGAIYVDTETSLFGHVLCGKSPQKAVNGVVLNDTSASFHPNTLGHSLLAERVAGTLGDQSLDTYVCRDGEYVSCPGGDYHDVETPDYFKKAIDQHSKSLHDWSLVNEIVKLPGSIFINVSDYTVGPNNLINILLYSDKKHLGTYRANSRGGLQVELPMPSDVPYGYHTLEIESIDPSGETIKFWKIIEVRSSDSEDYDGDGIPNDRDDNQYVALVSGVGEKDEILAVPESSPPASPGRVAGHGGLSTDALSSESMSLLHPGSCVEPFCETSDSQGVVDEVSVPVPVPSPDVKRRIGGSGWDTGVIVWSVVAVLAITGIIISRKYNTYGKNDTTE